MQYQYTVTGMTCQGCAAKVKNALEQVGDIESVDISLEENKATLSASRPPDSDALQTILAKAGAYQIEPLVPFAERQAQQGSINEKPPEKEAPLLHRLYPLFLVFAFLIGGVLLRQYYVGEWNSTQAMTNFMGGFFVVFSFFKFLDLRGFASAFRTYDPITKRWPGYGYLYPFVELGLGIAYLFGYQLFWANLITLFIIGIGTIGVARTVFNKQAIQCACLGTVFNLPMTKVTLTENTVMLVMAGLMLIAGN